MMISFFKVGSWAFLALSLVFVSPLSALASEAHGGETKLDRETLEFTKDWPKHHNPKITFMVKGQGRFIIDLESESIRLTKALIREVKSRSMDSLTITEYADGVSIKVAASLLEEAGKVDHPPEYKKGVVALKPSDEKNPQLYICLHPPKTSAGYVPIGEVIEGMKVLENLKPGSLIRDAFVSPYPSLEEHHP